MKQPKKLFRYQKEILTRKGINWNDYMLLSEDENTFTIIAKKENEFGNKEQLTFSK